MLKTLVVDMPEDVRCGWEVVVFEQRDDIGGTWLPDDGPFPLDQELPESPLYPMMTTNVPHPTMTIPHFPFPPETPLYPPREAVYRYHADIIAHFNLSSHIELSSRVIRSLWLGDKWDVSVEKRDSSAPGAPPKVERLEFDHLIVANGHIHYPSEPNIDGLDTWRSSQDRRVTHSAFYRHAEEFAGKNVLIVGAGSSARDISLQVRDFAKLTVYSGKETIQFFPREPEFPGITYKPRISSFTSDGVVFSDGSSLPEIDTVIFATGYEFRVPFLTDSGLLDIVPSQKQSDETLTTSLRYIRPLYRHIFPLDPRLPPTALIFVGVPMFASNQMLAAAQALLIGHALADESLLPSREDMLSDLHAYEARLREAGFDPGYVGHRLIPLPGDDYPDADAQYQDAVVRILQNAGLGGRACVPAPGQNFTEKWRRLGRGNAVLMRRKWEKIAKEGEEAIKLWVSGSETEEQWEGVMEKLIAWDENELVA